MAVVKQLSIIIDKGEFIYGAHCRLSIWIWNLNLNMNVLTQSNSTTTSYPQPFWRVYSLGMWGVGRSILGFRIVETKHENRRSYSGLHVSLFVACYVRWNISNIQIEMGQTLWPIDLMRDCDFCSYSKFLWSVHNCTGMGSPSKKCLHYWNELFISNNSLLKMS